MTHQYVNPLVAIVLGAVLLGESLDATTAVGALIVIGGVFATDPEREPRGTLAAQTVPAAGGDRGGARKSAPSAAPGGAE